MTEIDLSEVLRFVLLGLGIGFLFATLRILAQFVRFTRLRSKALVTWPAQRPSYYGFLLVLGIFLGSLVLFKLIVLQRPPFSAFGEVMMFVYYTYAFPLSFRIRRGLYEDGIWAESGFIPYSKIGGLSWREGKEITLVIIYRLRSLARSLTIPQVHYGEVRRLLRDKIGTHDIHFTLKSFDLGLDERDVV